MRTVILRRRLLDLFIYAALLTALAALVMYPQDITKAAREGLYMCGNVIIPSLFPFFILSALIVETGFARQLEKLFEPVMRPLFNVGGGCAAAFALGFIGGYPVGAKTVISLYENGECTKTEAERLLSFCNNSGPAFIFGVVGAGVFSSSKIGLLLYLAHSAASVIVGMLFRNWGGRRGGITATRNTKRRPSAFSAAFTNSVKSSTLSMVNICGFVIFFTVFIRLLFLSGIIPGIAGIAGTVLSRFGFDSAWAERLLTGIIELTSGVWSLNAAAPQITGSVAMAAFMLGWAGISVHFQVLSFIGTSGLSVKTYLLGKFLQGVISAALVLFLFRLFFSQVQTAALMAEQVSSFANVGFLKAGAISLAGALIMLTLFYIGTRVRKS